MKRTKNANIWDLKTALQSVWVHVKVCVCVWAHNPCVYLWREGLCWGEMALRWCPTCLSAVFKRSCSSRRSRSARRDTLRAFLRECLSFPTRSFNRSFLFSSSATRSSSCPTRSSSSNNTFCTEEHSSWKIKGQKVTRVHYNQRSVHVLTTWPCGMKVSIQHYFHPLSALLLPVEHCLSSLGPYTCQCVCDGGS